LEASDLKRLKELDHENSRLKRPYADLSLEPGRPRKRSDRLIADRAYDSNAACALLVLRGIEPIIPARGNNRRATHQGGRRLCRYRRRWIVERTIGWLGNFRRLTVRYDQLLETYSGFFIWLVPS
jgi:transposase